MIDSTFTPYYWPNNERQMQAILRAHEPTTSLEYTRESGGRVGRAAKEKLEEAAKEKF
jgi:hypothetical protein